MGNSAGIWSAHCDYMAAGLGGAYCSHPVLFEGISQCARQKDMHP